MLLILPLQLNYMRPAICCGIKFIIIIIINYISMVEAFKTGPFATTPLRICMNSSMRQP